MILSVSLLISAKRDQDLFSHYLEESLTNDTQLGAASELGICGKN